MRTKKIGRLSEPHPYFFRPPRDDKEKHGWLSSRQSRATAVPALQRTAHWYHNRRRSLRQRGGGGRAWSHLRRQKDTRFLPECSPSPKGRYRQGYDTVREGMPADEHPPPPEHRPVFGRVFPARLAIASPRHGATADEPSRPAGPRNGPSSPARRAQTLLPAQPKVLDSARRGERPNLPPRAIAAHHPPRLVGQKRSPELGDGGQDSRPGRGSYRASYESCSHHDKGTRGWCLYASRSSRRQASK